MASEDWSRRRGDAALRRAEALARQQRAESDQAAVLVRRFAADARAARLTPTRLTARSYTGGTRYKTQVQGWYLKRDRSVGVGTDGEFYVLSAPPRFLSRFTGVHLEPAPPPLELGRGARDGESMPMADALAKRLAGGDDWGR